MKRLLFASTLGLWFAVLPSAPARSLENIPLVWRPTTDIVASNALASSATIEVKPFTDGRKEPTLIGENREDKVPKRVTTNDNVSTWCSTHLADVLQRSGFHVATQKAQVILSGEVLRFFVDETGNYEGEIILKLTARSRKGTTLWTKVVKGTTERFGRSYKADNYYETLSDSLIDIVGLLRQDTGFNKAIFSKR